MKSSSAIAIAVASFLAGITVGAIGIAMAKRLPSSVAAITNPSDVSPEDAAVIRKFLEMNTDSGKWEEVEWKKVVPPNGETIRFFGIGMSGKEYGVNLSYRTQNRTGGMSLKSIHCIFHESGNITVSGGPLPEWATRNIKRDPAKTELYDPQSATHNSIERAGQMFEEMFDGKPK